MFKAILIGRAERVNFPELKLLAIPARIDTGAKTSSVWASNISESNGVLTFELLGGDSEHYTGQVLSTKQYETRVIASSNGAKEERYVIKLLVEIKDRRVRASFSLANRASQTYPVLVGRNVLRGKFIIDVKLGQPLLKAEQLQSSELQNSRLNHKRQT